MTDAYNAPRRITRADFDGLPYGTPRFLLASSVLRKYQYDSTNGFDYGTKWRKVREQVLKNDGPIDFITGELIDGPVLVHHLNELNKDSTGDDMFGLENLIPVSRETHQKIHWAGAQQRPRKHNQKEVPKWLE